MGKAPQILPFSIAMLTGSTGEEPPGHTFRRGDVLRCLDCDRVFVFRRAEAPDATCARCGSGRVGRWRTR